MTVELYDVTGNTLLGSVTNDMGVVWLNANDTAFSNDFLIRVSGPAGVSYPYRSRVGWPTVCVKMNANRNTVSGRAARLQ